MFNIEGQEFGWEEIVVAAQIWGEWRPVFESVRQSLGCLRLADETGQLPAAAELHEAATIFRYAHNLISAEEAQGWLKLWQITVDDWMNYLRGQLLQERWAARRKKIAAAHRVSDAEVAEVFKTYAVCSGKLGEWTVKLAGRAALAARSGWFGLSEPERSLSPRGLIDRIEFEFERQRQQVITRKLVEAKIADRWIEWIRFDCRYVWFPEERIAREAAFCVREDGLTLDEVAYDALGVVQHWSFYLDEIEAAVRPYFLAAKLGDWLGPIRMMEGFPLFAIIHKTLPTADDPQIRARAEDAIVGICMEQAMNERVKWA